ncbi:MAG: oligosaccharide flippase family protein [Candidatus Daviesbacteria bacterium]|nr:oligosaccharide flippase family protein [Candidatus Daviesbacteria bacterium]
MKDQFLQIFQTATLKQSVLTIVSTILNGALGISFYIILARNLGPSSFGIFALAVISLTLISDITNLGTDTGLIRFVGKYFSKESGIALKFLKLGLEVKIFSWLVILMFGLLLTPFVAESIFLKSELIIPLRLSLIGAGGALLFSFSTSAVQAYQKFLTWSWLTVGTNGLRLAVLFCMILVGSLNLYTGLWIYIAIPFLGFLISLLILPKFLFVKNELTVASEFFHYNKWVALFIIVAAISSRLDTYLVARFLPTSSIGIYSAASQVAGVIPQLVFAIATVVAPKLASFTTKAQVITYLKKLQILVLGLAGLGLLFLPAVFFVIPFLFGQAYESSIHIFIILFIAQLIFLISLPVHQAIFYYFAKPAVFVVVSLIHLLIVSILGFLMVTRYGLEGAALTVLVGSISNLVIPSIWVIVRFKKI